MIYLKAVSALALVLGLLGLFYYLVQRMYNRTAGGVSRRRIQVVERVPIGDKRMLLLVEVGHHQFLLGATGNNISLLSSISQGESVEECSTAEESDEKSILRPSFRRLLESFR